MKAVSSVLKVSEDIDKLIDIRLRSLSHINDMNDMPAQDTDPGLRLMSQKSWQWMDAGQNPWGQSQ